MKWFFAYNGVRPAVYDVQIRVMVRSALANTSLDPHLIWYGPPDDPIVSFARSEGVTVIEHTPSVLGDLRRIKAKFPDYHFNSATGAYLRVDLPLICRERGFDDPYVLYTDCDVVFMREFPQPQDHEFLRPAYFACAPQDNAGGKADINSGVMVMNTSALASEYEDFRRFITSGDTLYHELFKQGAFDQAAYRLFYSGRWDKLPLEYNWRPYWGVNEEALILHFHGLKITQARDIMAGTPGTLTEVFFKWYERDPGAYAEYLARIDRYL